MRDLFLSQKIVPPPSATPDHMLNFKVWSWGGMKTIKMPVRQFLPYYYGYVSALY